MVFTSEPEHSPKIFVQPFWVKIVFADDKNDANWWIRKHKEFFQNYTGEEMLT